MDWRGACRVPLYKGKGGKCERSNSRDISLLSVVVKLYGIVLIKRVWQKRMCDREKAMRVGQDRGCKHQVNVKPSIWPGACQWRIYYHRMWGQLSCNYLQ